MLNDTLTCPCCGYKTISDEHEICEVCAWQYNDFQNTRPDDSGGPNKISLRDAQGNFMKWGAKSMKHVDSVRPPGPDDVKDLNWQAL